MSQPPYCLDSYNILGLRSFLSLRDTEFNTLTFEERFESRTGNGAIMGKNVGAGLLLDKTKTFGFVEPLNGSFNCIRHNNILNFK